MVHATATTKTHEKSCWRNSMSWQSLEGISCMMTKYLNLDFSFLFARCPGDRLWTCNPPASTLHTGIAGKCYHPCWFSILMETASCYFVKLLVFRGWRHAHMWSSWHPRWVTHSATIVPGIYIFFFLTWKTSLVHKLTHRHFLRISILNRLSLSSQCCLNNPQVF